MRRVTAGPLDPEAYDKPAAEIAQTPGLKTIKATMVIATEQRLQLWVLRPGTVQRPEMDPMAATSFFTDSMP
jgi:hypothetical protein